MKRISAPPPPIPPQSYIFPPAKEGCYYGDPSLYQQEIEDPNEPLDPLMYAAKTSDREQRVNEHVSKLSQPTSRQIEAFSETRLRLEETQRGVVVPDSMRRFNNKNKTYKRLFSVFPASVGCDDPNMERGTQKMKHNLPPLRSQTSRFSGSRQLNGKLGNTYEWQPCLYEPVQGHQYRGTRSNIHLRATSNGEGTQPWRMGTTGSSGLFSKTLPDGRTLSQFPDEDLRRIRDSTRARQTSPFRNGAAPLSTRDLKALGEPVKGVEYPNPYRPSEEIHVETTCLESGVSGHRFKDTSVYNSNYNSRTSPRHKTIPVSQCYDSLSEKFGSKANSIRVLKEGKSLHTKPWRVSGPPAPLVLSDESRGALETVWSDTRTCEHKTQATKLATGRL